MGELSRRTTLAIYATAALGLLNGCGADENIKSPEFEARDSAGVEIVLSGPPRGGETAGWRIVQDPELQIGSVDGDAAYLFEWIGDAVRLPDQRIVVSDRRSMDIRVFDADGRHQGSFGRSGPGPREFGGPPFLAWRQPDTLVIWDGGHLRLSLFDLTGDLLSQRSYSSAVAGLSRTGGVHAWQISADGTVLWAGRGPSRSGTGITTAYLSVGMIDGRAENARDFGVLPLSQGLMLDIGIGFGNWFAPTAHAALGPRPFRVGISSPVEWEIRFFDETAGLRRILRSTIPRVPVTTEVRTERREYLVDWGLQFRLPRGRGESVDDQFPVPDSLPAVASLKWDRSDNLWVGRRVPDPNATEDYDVFNINGRWLCTVSFPMEMGRILEIGEDYVLAASRDDLGVAYLRRYRLLKTDR